MKWENVAGVARDFDAGRPLPPVDASPTEAMIRCVSPRCGSEVTGERFTLLSDATGGRSIEIFGMAHPAGQKVARSTSAATTLMKRLSTIGETSALARRTTSAPGARPRRKPGRPPLSATLVTKDPK